MTALGAVPVTFGVLSTHHYYVAFAVLFGVGVYTMVADTTLVRKVIGLNVFQTSVFLFFLAASYREGGSPPLLDQPEPHVNPLPHVLILTAIVVGVALTAVALALIVRIYAAYGTLDEATLRRVMQDE